MQPTGERELFAGTRNFLTDPYCSAEQHSRSGFRAQEVKERKKAAPWTKASKSHFILVLALLYWLPVTLVLTGVVPFSLRTAMLLLIFAFAAIYSFLQRHSAEELGLGRGNLPKALGINLLAGIAGAGLLLLLPLLGMHERVLPPPQTAFVFFYVLVSSPVQEFLFRSFLFAEMRRSGIRSPLWQVLISAASFALLHAVYLDPLTGLLTFLAGLVWGVIYLRVPNLAGVSLSHAIVGMVAIMAGIARRV